MLIRRLQHHFLDDITASKRSRSLIVLLTLFLVHVSAFWDHYRGLRTFPWDFLGGYHAQAFGWYLQGSVFSPPEWFPWTSLGFPAALAVQAGGWYLPMAALDVLGVAYSVEVATALQSAHVLFGAFGAYLLLRVLGLPWSYALFGSILFHFSSGFYSNQQHVDIIRAYSLAPWLLWSLHPAVLKRSPYFTVLSVVILFQLLVGGYPGNIVALAYTCAAYTLILLWRRDDARDLSRVQYIASLVIIVVSASLLSALKWMPFFAAQDLMSEPVRTSVMHSMLPHHMMTLLFGYERDFLANDITMRSAYVPLAGLIGLFFIKTLGVAGALGIVFVAMAFIFSSLVPMISPANAFFPGMSISRFPYSDWRPVLHLGLIVLGCLGWQALFSGGHAMNDFARRVFFASAAMTLVFWIALDVGYTMPELRRPLVLFGTLVIIAAGFLLVRVLLPSYANRGVYGILAVLCLAAVADGLHYHRSESLAWRLAWNDAVQVNVFSLEWRPIGPPGPTLIERRPARIVVGDGIDEILRFQNSSHYNRCWYERTFCVFGYDNLRFSIPHNEMINRLRDPHTGPATLEFLKRPQQLVLLPLDAEFDPVSVPNDSGPFVSMVPGATGVPLFYSAEQVHYRISTPVPLRAVENEMWWKDWSVTLCSDHGCRTAVPSEPTSEYLRSWIVPPGDWLVKLEFSQAGGAFSRFAAALGVLILSAWVTASMLLTKTRRQGTPVAKALARYRGCPRPGADPL